MVSVRNIHALDHFKRNTADFRERLKRSGEPAVLTVDGKAELVVQSAESYQRMVERMEELEVLAAVREGLADVEAGRVEPASRVFRELRRKFGIAPARRSARKRRR